MHKHKSLPPICLRLIRLLVTQRLILMWVTRRICARMLTWPLRSRPRFCSSSRPRSRLESLLLCPITASSSNNSSSRCNLKAYYRLRRLHRPRHCPSSICSTITTRIEFNNSSSSKSRLKRIITSSSSSSLLHICPGSSITRRILILVVLR